MDGSFKQSLKEEEKIIYLECLLYVLNSDKNNADSGKEYLQQQAEEIGFPLKELKKIKKIRRPETIANRLLDVRNVRLRRYFIREMVMLSVADHEISDVEMCHIYKIGCAVGVKEEKINDFFLWAAQGVEWQLEGVRLVEDDL